MKIPIEIPDEAVELLRKCEFDKENLLSSISYKEAKQLIQIGLITKLTVIDTFKPTEIGKQVLAQIKK